MLGVLCIIGCVINKGGFWDYYIFVVDTHLPHFEALAYVLAHFDGLAHVVILVSSAFIFQRFAEVWYSVFAKRSSFKKFAESSQSVHRSVFAESSKAFIFQKFAVKFYFGLSLHIFQHCSSLSLENVCNSWCMHQTGFSSAAIVPQSKFTEWCSSAAVVPPSKSTEMWSLAAPFDHDLWYFWHRTNEQRL